MVVGDTSLQRLTITTSLLLLAYVGLLACHSASGFPATMTTGSHWPLLMDKPLGEDGFYMLTVADNIATSGHIRYNGGLPATGIQPLVAMLSATVSM